MTPFEIIIEILKWSCAYVLLWNAYILVFNRGTPNIKTAPAIRQKIIALLKKEIEAKQNDNFTIIDPGCGNGDFSCEMAKAFPNAKIIGLEIDRIAYLRCLINKKLRRLPNVEFLRGDLYAYDMSGANAVIAFQHIYDMGRLAKKLKQDLKPGTLVTSNKFQLYEWEPIETIAVKTLMPNQKALHLYRA